MESLQTKLFEAATQGSINSLQVLLKVDPLILDRAIVNWLNETPLHVAAMLGHVDFVKEMTRINPGLIKKVNSQKSTSLHMAAAKGHVEAVRTLLSVDQGVCLALDRNKLTPLHLAAAEGHVEVVKLLLEAQPDAARIGQSILHLCVRRYQLEIMEVIVKGLGDEGFLNSRDEHGNTILHLAVAEKQVETVKFLLSVGVELEATNEEGMTALDVLIRSKRDVRDPEIEKLLKHENSYTTTNDNNTRVEREKNDWESSLKRQEDWLEKTKSSLMVVAVLIATMAFQIAASPPGGVWQDDKIDSKNNTTMEAGTSVYAHRSGTAYRNFYTVNMTAFLASLSIILLLMSGLPLRRRFTMWILMVFTWISITAIVLCYTAVIVVLTPSDKYDSVVNLLGITVLPWVMLVVFILIAHAVKLVKKMWKLCARGRNNSTTAADDVAV